MNKFLFLFSFALFMSVCFCSINIQYTRYCVVRCYNENYTPKIYYDVFPSLRRYDIPENCEYRRVNGEDYCGYAPTYPTLNMFPLFSAKKGSTPDFRSKKWFFDGQAGLTNVFDETFNRTFNGFFYSTSECLVGNVVKTGYTYFEAKCLSILNYFSSPNIPFCYFNRRKEQNVVSSSLTYPGSYQFDKIAFCTLNKPSTFTSNVTASTKISHSLGNVYTFSNSKSAVPLQVDLSKTVSETNSYTVSATYSSSSSETTSHTFTTSFSSAEKDIFNQKWDVGVKVEGKVGLGKIAKVEGSLEAEYAGTRDKETTDTNASENSTTTEDTNSISNGQENVRVFSSINQVSISSTLTLPPGCFMKVAVIRQKKELLNAVQVNSDNPFGFSTLDFTEESDMVAGFRVVNASSNCAQGGAFPVPDDLYGSIGNDIVF